MRNNKGLKGRFDAMAVESTNIPEVNMKSGTFKISVKDDEENLLYENKEEPFDYPEVPSLSVALNYLGAELSKEEDEFLKEALAGAKTGPAVKELLDIFNDNLRTNAKNNAYQKIFTSKKPLTEENITNANASIVRNFIKTQNVSAETAIKTLQEYKVIPADFTLEEFKSNKGKR